MGAKITPITTDGKSHKAQEGTVTVVGTFIIPTSYDWWVWEREAQIYWSMVTCQGSTRSELP